MPTTYSKILFHLVWSTKHRDALIVPDLQPRLYEYIGGIIRGEKGVALAIGGMPDHIHILVRWRTDEAIASLIRDIKANSSKWVHDLFPSMRAFAWQGGGGVFTVSESQSATVKRYIANQAEHHRDRPFKDEFLEMLRRHNIDYNERYVFD